MRFALGIQYDGSQYAGWQTQPAIHGVNTLQDRLESALSFVAGIPIKVVCAGRTDAGVHALQQTVHFDSSAERPLTAWVRGANAKLPKNMSVRWAKAIPDDFHARFSATARRYTYILISETVRPALAFQQVAWTHLPLDLQSMRQAAALLIGEHDFSSFRASECQANSPIRTVTQLDIVQNKNVFMLTFEANAFLHHMVRNIVGALIYVGSGRWDVKEFARVFASKDRRQGAPTFWADGLYFCGARYPEALGLPDPIALTQTNHWPWAL